jgi:LPS-assembly protein
MRNRISGAKGMKICRRLLAIFFLLAVSGVLQADEIDLKSDRLEYDEENRFMIATGSVTITWQNKVMKADSVKFWVDDKIALAENNVSLEEGTSTLKANALRYNYKDGTGEATHLSGYSYPVFFQAEKAVRKGERTYSIDNVAATTCNLARPHYTIRARHANIDLDRRITIYGGLFYLRDIPIFYLPIFSQPLGSGRKDSLEIRPGYNNVDGLVIRTIFGFPISKNSYGKLYLDFFSKRGWGEGAEYTYYEPNKIKGTVYGYYIKERTTGNERWNFRTSYWQRYNQLWIGQADADVLSDTSFNNIYAQDNWQRINQQLHSFVSFTRQSQTGNLRILAERFDVFNSSTGVFNPSIITAPAVTYTKYSRYNRLLKFYTNFSASFQNQYLSSYDYYLLTSNADYNITRDYRLTRKLTFKPRFGLSETWQDRTSKPDLSDRFVTRYYTDLNLRYRVARWVDWDLTYNYKLRSEVNSLYIDYFADDYGEETNNFTFVNSMFAGRFTVRNTTGYNFRKARSIAPLNWYDKFRPLVNEVTWVPSFPLFMYVREENTLHPFSLSSVQMDSRIGNVEGRYISLGVFYQSYRSSEMDFSTGFGFWPNKKWRIDYNIWATSLNHFTGVRTSSQEVKLYRDLHCWELKLIGRTRPGNQEIYVQLDLKSSARNRRQLYPQGANEEFYPWR